MASLRKVAVIGASGNFGAPITAALVRSGMAVTIISRLESASTFPGGLPVVKIDYTAAELTRALAGQDAVVCAVGPRAVGLQAVMIDAAEAAGVRRFVVDDFGWGPDVRSFPEFAEVHARRAAQWEYAKARAAANPAFTWTGVTIGNPIDWAMKKFPVMGFDVVNSTAIIYGAGEEQFTGTTLAGIGQSVVGVLRHPGETANRFVRVLSVKTCQAELLRAFEKATGTRWGVRRSSAGELLERGRGRLRDGDGRGRVDLLVAQLYDEGEARCLVAPSWGASDSGLLGVEQETADQVALKSLGLLETKACEHGRQGV